MSCTVPKREDAAPGADEPRRRTRSASVPSPHAFRLEPMTENRTTAEKNERDLEEEIHTDLKETMTYGSYLDLDRLLGAQHPDRKSTRLNSSHVAISYAVFCLKK